MNIRQIEAFHAVIETGSATRAAERLGITQPAVSKLLKSFSDHCGFLLFQRKGGQLVPTREAQILAGEVNKVFNGASRIKEVARAVREHEWGEISIAAPPAFAVNFLPRILAENVQQIELRMQVLSRTSPQIIEMVAAQQVDLGLSVMAVDHPDIDSEHLVTFPLICLLPANHRLAAKTELHINDLRAEHFISLPSSDCSFTRADRAFQVSGGSMKRRIEVPFSETAAMLVAQGAGVTIVPPFAGIDIDESLVVRRPIQPVEHVDLWLLKPKQRHVPLVVGMIEDLLTQTCATIGKVPLQA
ncbi:LysR substrate-binding domain-containing protein [Mesorhizobium sp. CAU 1732]|uniref:LysR family transcriptional regulator n=1 Tax=Mesorhizobium sp. CAU 1732 TaxID=3140358 RepID=UPI0032608E72